MIVKNGVHRGLDTEELDYIERPVEREVLRSVLIRLALAQIIKLLCDTCPAFLALHRIRDLLFWDCNSSPGGDISTSLLHRHVRRQASEELCVSPVDGLV